MSGDVIPYPSTHINMHAPHAFGAHHNPTCLAMTWTSTRAAILAVAGWANDYRRRYHNEDFTLGNNESEQARENGVAASRVTHEIRQDKGDRRTKDSDNDDPGPVPPLRRLRKYSADLHSLSPPTIGGSEEDWMRSNDEVPDGKPRRRVGKKHCPEFQHAHAGPPRGGKEALNPQR